MSEQDVTDAGSAARAFKVNGDRIAMSKHVFPMLRDLFGLPPRTKSLTINVGIDQPPTITVEYMPEIDADGKIVGAFKQPEETFR